MRSVWEREKSVSIERDRREMEKNNYVVTIYKKPKLDGLRAIKNLSTAKKP